MNQQPHSSATTVLTKAEKLEQLRRKMASIPARSDGTERATPSVMLRPVDEREPTPIVATAQSTLRMLPVPPPLGDARGSAGDESDFDGCHEKGLLFVVDVAFRRRRNADDLTL